MKFFIYLFLLGMLILGCNSKEDSSFYTNDDYVKISNNGNVVAEQWYLDPEVSPDITEVECKKEINKITFSDSKDSITFSIKNGETKDFYIVKKNTDSILMRIIGIKPILNFSDAYINANKDKIRVEIPEVSELANILIALHKDAEKDKNMTDSSTEYFKRVRKHFKPYLNHPIMDTIHKYVNGMRYIESIKDSVFSNDSYMYYFRLKTNACLYNFSSDSTINNPGYIRDMTYGWSAFNPMKDSLLMGDFAKISNFKAFYNNEKSYYNELIKDYNTLIPLEQMKKWLDQKFGFTYDNFTVYFSPLVFGSHAAQNFEDNGFHQTFMFVARAFKNKEEPLLAQIIENSRIVFTEIDHNYVNPISDTFVKEIDVAFADRGFWAKGEASSAYESPYMVFNEYMTFGTFSLYIYDIYGNEEFEKHIPKMEHLMADLRGFHKFKEFNQELIKLHKNNPDMDIKSLYKNMLTWCKQQQ